MLSSLENRLAVGLIILLAALTWLPDLAHPGIHAWDESIHQAIVRGTADTFWYPHIYVEPLYPVNVAEWWSTDAALHKPPGTAWLAALLIKLIGVTPFAARFIGFLGQLASALVLFDLARRFAGTWAAWLGAVAWVFLPFGWVLTQGHFFGDVIDCTLVGFVSLALWALVRGIEDESRALRWAALSGAFLACAFLTKYVLGLAPLGVAFVLSFGRLIKRSPGLQLRHLAVLSLVATALTTPWLVYSAQQWPEAFQHNVVNAILGHVTGAAGADVGSWRRPVDGIFIELVMTEFQPLPVALTWLAAAWLLITSFKTRNVAALGLALWLWSTWVLHSAVSAKAPAHVWNAAPAAMAGYAILWRDVWRSKVLGAMTLIAATVPWWLAWVPQLSKVRELIPAVLQSRTVPGPVEALLVMVVVGVVVAVFKKRLPFALGIVGGLALTAALVVALPQKNVSQRESFREETLTSATKLYGLAIDPVIAKKSVLFQLFERDPSSSIFEVQNSMFWSGRMTWRRPVDLPAARAKGYHAYAVSSRAEPYLDVSEVPEHSPQRVYDAEQPAQAPDVPRLARVPAPIDLKNGQTLLGLSHGTLDVNHDQYALYLHADGVPGPLHLVFELQNHVLINQTVEPEASLFSRQSLRGVKWFIVPVIGPRGRQVQALTIGGTAIPFPR